MKGRWREVFAAGETPDAGRDRPVYLEIGCGKGKFILTRAEKNPDACYIAVEGQANVILRAMEKAEAAELEKAAANGDSEAKRKLEKLQKKMAKK